MLDRTTLNKLYRYSLAVCNDENEAYDLLHNSIEKLVRTRRLQKNLPLTYFYRTIKTTYIDQYRKAQKEPIADEGDSVVEMSAPSFEDLYLENERLNLVLNQLNYDDRELIFLHVVESFTAAELAEQLEKPRGTILAKLHRIKARLRKLLDAQGEKGGNQNGQV